MHGEGVLGKDSVKLIHGWWVHGYRIWEWGRENSQRKCDLNKNHPTFIIESFGGVDSLLSMPY
jgi:hypothetical protein